MVKTDESIDVGKHVRTGVNFYRQQNLYSKPPNCINKLITVQKICRVEMITGDNDLSNSPADLRVNLKANWL